MRSRLRIPYLILFCVALSLLIPATVVCAQTPRTGTFQGQVEAVAAGDSLDVRVGGGWTITVRLHGVDCPTSPRVLREEATRTTTRLVNGAEVRVVVRGTERGSTLYGDVYPPPERSRKSVNETLIAAGLARWASRYAPNRADLRAAEATAHRAHRGLWGGGVSAPSAPSPNARIVGATHVSPPHTSPAPVSPSPTSPSSVSAADTRASHAAPLPLRGSTSLLAALGAALLAFAGLLARSLRRGDRLTGRRGVALALLAAYIGGGVWLLALLPPAMLALRPGERTAPLLSTALGSGALVLIAALLGIRGVRLLAHERCIRTAPGAGDLSNTATRQLGFVRATGEARALGAYARSEVGNLPGLYVREVTERFTAEGDDGRRRPGARAAWRVVRDITRSVDFLLYSTAGDGTAAALVRAGNGAAGDDGAAIPSPADFLARHVARFYNEVPSDRWPDTPYEGDTRSEVFLVPSGARLTVWGRLYEGPDEPRQPQQKRLHLGPDPLTGRFLVVDGPEERAWSSRTARMAMGLLLLAAACGIGAAYLAVTAGAVALSLAAAALGAVLLTLLALLWRTGAQLEAEAHRATAEGPVTAGRFRSAHHDWCHTLPGSLIAPALFSERERI